MTSLLTTQTGVFMKAVSSRRLDAVHSLIYLASSHSVSCSYERSCMCSTFRPCQSVWRKDEPTFQSTEYKSKYLMFSHNLTHSNRALYYCTSLKCNQKHILISQNVFSQKPTSLSQKYSNHTFYLCQLHRLFQFSTLWRKEESKVEQTIKALKDMKSENDIIPIEPDKIDVVPAKKSWWQRFKDFCIHYYHGFCLLAIDMKISAKLLWQLLHGKSLTRREHNQLVRTTADMFRLVPLLVVIIVPFAEFLLPFALILFPNLLPSTFQDAKDEKEKIKKKCKAKLEMAKFLQKTIKESPVQAKNHDGQTAESFALFMQEIRKEGTKPRTKDIMKFAKLFEDEITLDNLSRQQLEACCTILNITPIGTNALLRYFLKMKLKKLRADDIVIQREGVESLTKIELQAASRARGMQSLGISEERLRAQMQQWLRLHLVEKIPPSLLLLSRALYLPDNLTTEEKIGATITKLADRATDVAKVKVAEISGEKVDNKTKFEIIKQEEELIAAEKAELAKENQILEEQNIQDIKETTAAEPKLNIVDKAKSLEISPTEILHDKAKDLKSEVAKKQDEAANITAKDIGDMVSILNEIAKERKLNIEQEKLEGLKEEVSVYKEDLEVLNDVAKTNGKKEKDFEESLAARHLAKKVESMISRLDTAMDDLTEEKTSIQQKMAKGGEVSQEEMDKYKTNIVSIDELIEALKRLKKVPSNSKAEIIFQALDQDKDGVIDISDALRVLELLSHEHLKLSPSQMDEVLKILKNEARLEQEEHNKEKEVKEKH